MKKSLNGLAERAKPHLLNALAASQPCFCADLKHELLLQAVGIDRNNVSSVLTAALGQLLCEGRVKEYEPVITENLASPTAWELS